MNHFPSDKLFYYVVLLTMYRECVSNSVQNVNKFVLIRNSSIFVDKTVLLKNIFKYDHVLLTAPRKFGKSTNLQMVKLFLGNNNQKEKVALCFRNTNIWRDREFIVRHLCNYPVIYCDFKPKEEIRSFADVVEQLKMSIRDAFVSHNYLLESTKIAPSIKQQFSKYYRLELKGFDVGLKFLSEVLHIHHDKKVTVLIDDYDYLLTYSIFKKELDAMKTAQLIYRVIHNTIDLNEFVDRSVVMGCLPFKLSAQSSTQYLLKHFKYMEAKDFTPYFGFTHRETGNLLDSFGLARHKNSVFKWYGGYSYLHSDFYIYNPWSILMFIKTKAVDLHWVTPSSRRLLSNYVASNTDLKKYVSKLVSDESVTIHIVKSFTIKEIQALQNFVTFDTSSEDINVLELFLQLLLETGFFTYAANYGDLPSSVKVKIPNVETKTIFEEILQKPTPLKPRRDFIRDRGRFQTPKRSGWTKYRNRL